MSFPLTDDEKAQLLRQEEGRPGRHTFELCPMCGKARWRECHVDVPNDVEAHVGHGPCDRCQGVYQRAPELVEWVISVLKWRDRQLKITPLDVLNQMRPRG